MLLSHVGRQVGHRPDYVAILLSKRRSLARRTFTSSKGLDADLHPVRQCCSLLDDHNSGSHNAAEERGEEVYSVVTTARGRGETNGNDSSPLILFIPLIPSAFWHAEASVGSGWCRGGDGMNGINRMQITSAHPVNPVHPVLSSSRDEGRVVFLTTNNTNWTNEGRKIGMNDEGKPGRMVI